jgi:hypothetical protein
MRLIDLGKVDFELKVIDYQYPANDYDGYDANWLYVTINVQSPAASWSRSDPCLLAWEGHRLANWLTDLALGRECRPGIDFLESNLSFDVLARDESYVELRILFMLECRPLWRFPGDATNCRFF